MLGGWHFVFLIVDVFISYDGRWSVPWSIYGRWWIAHGRWPMVCSWRFVSELSVVLNGGRGGEGRSEQRRSLCEKALMQRLVTKVCSLLE